MSRSRPRFFFVFKTFFRSFVCSCFFSPDRVIVRVTPPPPPTMMAVSRGFLPARFALSLLLLTAAVYGVVSSATVPQDAVAADEDLMKASPLTVAQCRAGCLHKVRSRSLIIFWQISNKPTTTPTPPPSVSWNPATQYFSLRSSLEGCFAVNYYYLLISYGETLGFRPTERTNDGAGTLRILASRAFRPNIVVALLITNFKINGLFLFIGKSCLFPSSF